MQALLKAILWPKRLMVHSVACGMVVECNPLYGLQLGGMKGSSNFPHIPVF